MRCLRRGSRGSGRGDLFQLISVASPNMENDPWHTSRTPLRRDVMSTEEAVVPTIARFGPYRVFFYSNEGLEPPHVHVECSDGLLKFWLVPHVRLAGAHGLRSHTVRRVDSLVRDHQSDLLEAWYEFFGGEDSTPGR